MTTPPQELDGARVIGWATVSTGGRHTGQTVHTVNGRRLESACYLAIAQYAGSPQFYLFSCAADWTVLTDTCHDSLNEAHRQAEYEYAGVSGHWVALPL